MKITFKRVKIQIHIFFLFILILIGVLWAFNASRETYYGEKKFTLGTFMRVSNSYTQQQVHSLLGNPTSTYISTPNTHCWEYAWAKEKMTSNVKEGDIPTVLVCFNEKNKVFIKKAEKYTGRWI